jgi:pyrroloquinoline quinone biosynthesis protein B
VTADSRSWFLLNVSADVRVQLAACSELCPPRGHTRGTPIFGCVLTDAEIDHTSGLLQLREGCTFGIYSTPAVRRWLSEDLPIRSVLSSFADRPWIDLPLDEQVELKFSDGAPSGLRLRAFELGSEAPRFVPEGAAGGTGAVIGLAIEEPARGGKLVYAPGVANISVRLRNAAADADCLLIDGTFWSDDELPSMGIGNLTAREMGHVPVSGSEGSLNWLSSLPARHKVYVHINNTNPMLDENSAQFRDVTRRGVHVGQDGDEFEIQEMGSRPEI